MQNRSVDGSGNIEGGRLAASDGRQGFARFLFDVELAGNSPELKLAGWLGNAENIQFWHRSASRGDGFAFKGFVNRYPDFIAYTKKAPAFSWKPRAKTVTTPTISANANWAKPGKSRRGSVSSIGGIQVAGAFSMAAIGGIIRRL